MRRHYYIVEVIKYLSLMFFGVMLAFMGYAMARYGVPGYPLAVHIVTGILFMFVGAGTVIAAALETNDVVRGRN